LEEGIKINLIVLLIVGIIVALSLGSLGFAETVVIGSFVPITKSDEIIINPNAVIAKVSWIESATNYGKIEITGTKVTIENMDSTNHIFQVCALLSSSEVDNSLGCTDEDIFIASGASRETEIQFPFGISVDDIKTISLSIEEIS